MSQLLTDQRSFLEHFVSAGLKQRKALLRTLTDLQLKAIGEVIHNVLKGNVPVTSEQQHLLKRHRSILYLLADRTIRPFQKRSVIERAANPIKFVLNLALPHIPWLTNPS